MKIVIDDKIPFIRGAFELWADVVYLPGRSIDARVVADADALIVRTRTRCNAALLEGSRVRIVASATIGYDHIDTEWLGEHGIRWVNAPGCNSGSVMQYMTALLLFLEQKNNLDLRSLTLGIVGVGNVGSKVHRAARALGMKVLLNDPPRQREEEGTILHAEAVRGGTGFHHLRKLLTECDIITLHVPLTRDGTNRTFHLFDHETLSAMKSDAILINTSRGEVVDNIALREALKEGSLRAAALDVWEGEPDTDPELVALTDIATPHIAGYSVDGKANATINSVRMVAAGLGLPMRGWEPDGLPQPAEPVIDLAGQGSSSREQVAKAVFHTYPIEEDDLLFRNAREKFEYLRDNYRIRREFGSYSVGGAGPEAGDILYNLGFKIIE